MFRRNFSHSDGLEGVVTVKSKEPAVIAPDERSKICEMIFTPDSRTRLPSSDIGVYLNSQTPQVVKDYILDNIYGDTKRSIPSSGVDDATLHELTRGKCESVDEYAVRVTAFMNRQKKSVDDLAVFVRNRQRSLNQK